MKNTLGLSGTTAVDVETGGQRPRRYRVYFRGDTVVQVDCRTFGNSSHAHWRCFWSDGDKHSMRAGLVSSLARERLAVTPNAN